MLFLSQNGQPAQQHFLLQTAHSPPGTVVVIEELDSHHHSAADRDGLGHFGELFGSDPQSPSPTGLSNASTAVFDWLDGPGEGHGLGSGASSNGIVGNESNNFLRAPNYFEQSAGTAGNGQQAAAIYGTAGLNPYYQHYQPSSLAVHQLHHAHSQQQSVQIQLQQQQQQQSTVASSAGTVSSPTGIQTFVLRPPPSGRKSLSPEVSVDEEVGDRQLGAVQGANAGGGGQGQGVQGHTARTPPETLEWLQANYEEFKGASLPRCTLYEHYQNHCREAGLVPVNAASFGKLIRSVFKSLATRRLGTRGNSKYHYNGIRVKPNSPLAATMSQEEFQRMNAPQPPTHGGGGNHRHQRRQTAFQRRARRGGGATSSNSSSADEHVQEVQRGGRQIGEEGGHSSPLYASTQDGQAFGHSAGDQLPPQGAQIHVGGGRELVLPEVKLPSLDEGALLQFGLSLEHALKFFDQYREHGRELLDCVRHGRLESMERCWSAFWQGNIAGEGHEESVNGRPHDGELGQLRGPLPLDQHSLFRLCTVPQVLAYVERFDLKLYQLLLDVLFPSPLRLTLPGDLCSRVRHMAKSVEGWMEKALGRAAPVCLRRAKLGAVRLLAYSLTRFSSFAHLAITARNVLQNGPQVQQMHDDFNRIDFSVVHWQADWLCAGGHCPAEGTAWVRELVNQFRERLARRCSLEEWADWLESVTDHALTAWVDQPAEVQLARGKRFLLGWTFHTSLLLRDITLRSAQSFGQFHLVRLLFDDYLLLLMEQKLAKLTGQDPISLMAPEWLRTGPVMFGQTHQHQQAFPQLHQPPPSAQQYYAQIQQRPPTSQYQMQVNQLPPPGPEPPLDMLNGVPDDSVNSEMARPRGNSDGATTIHYVLVPQEDVPNGRSTHHNHNQQQQQQGSVADVETAEDWEMVEGGVDEAVGHEEVNTRQQQEGNEQQQQQLDTERTLFGQQ